MKQKPNSLLFCLSLLSLTFYFVYATILLTQYGFFEGLFFSFSLIGLLGLGIAGLFRWSSLALASVSISLPHLLAWVIDAIGFSLFKHSFFEFTESRFHPGLSNMEFFFSFYPLLLIPLSLIIPRLLDKPKKPPYLMTLISATGILLLSRYLFIGQSDPNCARLSCIDAFSKLSVHSYPWIFLLFYTTVSLFSVKLVTLYFQLNKQTAPLNRYPKTVLALYSLFSVVLMFSDTRNFLSTPRLFCSETPSKNDVDINCAYTLPYSHGFISLYFTLKNKGLETQHCNLYLTYQSKKEGMYEAVLIRPKNQIQLSVILPYPNDLKGSTVYLSSECEK